MPRFLLAASLSLLALATGAPRADAAVIDAQEVISTFGLVALGDLDAQSESEVPVFVGGNLVSGGYTANGSSSGAGRVAGLSGGLVVGGNVTGAPVNVNNGDLAIGGSATATINLNGGVAFGASVPSADVRQTFEALSTALSQRAGTPGAVANAADPNIKSLSSGAGVDGFATLNLADAGFLSGGTLAGFARDPGVTFIVNVPGQAIAITINSNPDDANTIFNFFEATSLSVNSTFGFGILAPFADVALLSGGTDTFVVGNDVTQRTEVRGTFAGALPATTTPPIPLPASALLLVGAMAGLGGLRAHRRAT